MKIIVSCSPTFHTTSTAANNNNNNNNSTSALQYNLLGAFRER